MRQFHMKKRIFCILFLICFGIGNWNVTVHAQKNLMLYARSAVLIDADSGRILYGQNEYEERANASTTKILTCILVLENANLSDSITVSRNAASQPKVHLGMTEGQIFRTEDLLYSLMLESHNDSAVALAESVDGTVEAFAGRMNRKAKEIGCNQTHFITPNGLDAQDSEGFHHTTAADLAQIMRYCIQISPQREKFLEITQTKQYSFQDLTGTSNYSCYNHNAFLHMMDGALSGKTGFTSEAGYCYVGALRQGERTFIVALLACGWPNHKSYKWADTKILMNYALENYFYREISFSPEEQYIKVEDGLKPGGYPVLEPVQLSALAEAKPLTLLLKEGEVVETSYKLDETVSAPVEKGACIGRMEVSLEGEIIAQYPIKTQETVEKRTFQKCFQCVILKYVNIND